MADVNEGTINANKSGVRDKKPSATAAVPAQIPQETDPEATRIELNALGRHFDLYLFTHTPLEEMQPPDKEELQKLNQIEQLPVAPPIPPKTRPQLPVIPSLTLSKPASRYEKTPEETRARRRAMFYTSALFGSGTLFEQMEDMAKLGRDMERKSWS